MRTDKASQFVESYLYGARGHRALEQSVFAAGERRGFSERKLRRAAVSLGITMTADCWELPSLRAEALDARSILALHDLAVPTPTLVMSGSARRHAA